MIRLSAIAADRPSSLGKEAAAAPQFDDSKLVLAVERARSLLDDGDVTTARVLAGGAYEQAKAAAQFASRYAAVEELAGPLIRKARMLQGEALLIEAQAKIRLAAEWTIAQESGTGLKGRPKSVPNVEHFSVSDTGLSRKEMHEARKLAGAELREPGIVERAIAARLAAGLEPSRANLRAAVGTDSATAAERGNNLYETPAEAMRTLLSLMRFSANVSEPACGRGAISRMLEDAGYEVELSDLVDYGTADRHGELQRVEDFMASAPTLDNPDPPDIVSNPPYGQQLNAFVAHALRAHRPRRMALLLNLNFLCGFDDPDRCFAMDECPPARIYVFTRRLPMMHRDGWDGPEASSRMNTAWFVWELRGDSYGDTTEILRVDWKVFENATLMGPSTLRQAQGDGAGPAEVPPEAASKDAPCGLTWDQLYANGRIVAKAGSIDVGAVFPNSDAVSATWAFWLSGLLAQPLNHAKSVDAAKTALLKRWAAWLADAKLEAAPTVDAGGTAPPSVLPDISPAGGEIGRPKRRAKPGNKSNLEGAPQ